jgi:hypothetical protein
MEEPERASRMRRVGCVPPVQPLDGLDGVFADGRAAAAGQRVDRSAEDPAAGGFRRLRHFDRGKRAEHVGRFPLDPGGLLRRTVGHGQHVAALEVGAEEVGQPLVVEFRTAHLH